MASTITAGTTSGTALNFAGDTSGVLTVQGVTMGSGGIGAGNATRFKNRIINGDMRIDQRNAGASITPSTDSTYSLDRWVCRLGVASKYSVQQNAGSVTLPVGFVNYLGVTSTSAYSSSSGDYFALAQYIEGFNFADLQWGTVNAKTVTLSFWVYSSLTGTFGGVFKNSAYNRSYPFSYTISSANTWTQITITVAGDTSGTWIGSTNGIGAIVGFNLGCGSTYLGTANTWAASNLWGATGSTAVTGTNGATFYITGVQLEVGSSATGFEYVNYGTQLNLCQRYYETTAALTGLIVSMYSTGSGYGAYYYRVTKRATPTVTNASIGTFTVYCASATYGVASFGNTAATNMCSVGVNLSSAVPSNGYSSIVSSSDANSMMFSAEL